MVNSSGTNRHRGRGVAAWGALAASLLLTPVLPVARLAGAAPVAQATPGFKLVGQIPDTVQKGNSAHGLLMIDQVHRRAFQFDKLDSPADPDFIQFRVYALDVVGADGQLKQLPRIRINGDTPVGLTNTLKGDRVRTSVNELAWDAIMTIDPAAGRFFYSAGAAVYEVSNYNAATGAYSLSKWIAPPEAEVDSDDLRAVATAALVTQPFAMTYDKGTGGPGPRLYQAGQFKVNNEAATPDGVKGAWIAAWDASPGSGDPSVPDLRQKWIYKTRTCTKISDLGINTQPVVFRSGKWLYTFCDGSTDKSARGVLRVELAPDATGELAPTGLEEFFPGASGNGVATFGDAASERVYVMSSLDGGRNVLAFDGHVSDDTGAYIGEVALSRDSLDRVTAGVDPATGRWYFYSKEGLWQQDGRLKRLAQATLFQADRDGRPLGFVDHDIGPWYPLRVDPAVLDASGTILRGARVFVWRPTSMGRCVVKNKPCYEVYEDTSAAPREPLPPSERTINEPEGPGKAGVYAGVTSAYGFRLRLMRGLSSAWPNGVPLTGSTGSLEDPRPSPPQDLTHYATDPFFYHAGECGSSDREITFGRVLNTQLNGGLFNRGAGAEAVAVDPDVHRPSAKDDTQTRDDVDHPDACTIRLLRTLTVPACRAAVPSFVPPQNESQMCTPWESGAKQFNDGLAQGVSNFGQDWPYLDAICGGDQDPAPQTTTNPAPGTADVSCGASTKEPSVVASTTTQMTPDGADALAIVQDVQASTNIVRQPAADAGGARGITAQSHVILRGVSLLGGLVLFDTIELTATAHAEGYAGKDTAYGRFDRRFSGLTIADRPVCPGECDQAKVLEELNGFLGAQGYAKAPTPEDDATLGTKLGTLAVVQKDVLQQDADATMNRDFSAEWTGLEIGIYRDSAQRGRGRWVIQLGGVFAQTQFGVIESPPEVELGNFDVTVEPPPFDLPDLPVVLGTEATPGVTFAVAIAPGAKPAASAAPAPDGGGGGLFRQVRAAVERLFEAAFLLAALWALVYGPIYVARRRGLLKQVMAS